ncbi:MAG: Peptidase [Frankiales bacterium]|nr:Peptidase [Frankiales bacterium]
MRRLVLLLVLLVIPVGPAEAAPRPGFRWPLAGRPAVVRAFEPPQTRYGAGHRGVDLAGSTGEAVLAAGPGRVTFAGTLAGRGVVTVTHDGGLRTTYEPVTARVRVGQLVPAGASLGQLGAGHPGCRAAACLHWGLLRGQTYLDPLSLLAAQQVRLLPLGEAPPPPTTVTRARSAQTPGDSDRSVQGVVATAALLTGVGLLLKRPQRPEPPPGGTLIDLRAERRRRRAA